ncbi:hypothetical protein FB567DRAFT_142932 [Paraphoma chrysanthemicola]|uniref:Uncharacterized protein n=1 Tax=Paraphoma chrysanthemicola TaxID=798071 RepID=A0A8K0VV32_9PLEO|nr:hypothetical protein FB567DRAFT_142932 [Paraphoma chrysanthemicola]
MKSSAKNVSRHIRLASNMGWVIWHPLTPLTKQRTRTTSLAIRHHVIPNSQLHSPYLDTRETMQPTTPSFFGLPRELRDLVYHFLWLGTPDLKVPYLGKASLMTYCPANGENDVLLRGIRSRTEILPSWLFINKALFIESLDLLSNRSKWVRLPLATYNHNAGSTTIFGPDRAYVVDLPFKEYHPHSLRLLTPFSDISSRERMLNDTASHIRIAADMSANGKPKVLRLTITLEELRVPEVGGAFDYMSFDYLEPFQQVYITSLIIHAFDPVDRIRTAVHALSSERLMRLKRGVQKVARVIFDQPQPELKYEKHWQEHRGWPIQHCYRYMKKDTHMPMQSIQEQ